MAKKARTKTRARAGARVRAGAGLEELKFFTGKGLVDRESEKWCNFPKLRFENAQVRKLAPQYP
jgi:hypothetical protein